MRRFAKSKIALFAALTTLSACFPQANAQSASQAQNYPQRPVRIVVASSAGGGPDILARVMAEKMRTQWGQAVIVEDRPGAGQNLGAEAVARAAPDGYTLLLTPQSPLVVNKALYKKLSYDPDTLEAVTILVRVPVVLVATPSVPAKNTTELIQFAKANPNKINYGTPGQGSAPHLISELFQSRTGTKMTQVPYKSNQLATLAMLAGEVDVMFLDLGQVLPYIRDGKLRAFGMASEKRHPAVPDVPTISESVPGVVASAWWAMMVPPKTPPDIIAKVNQAVVAAMKEPEMTSKLAELGNLEAVGNSPAEATTFIGQERKLWGDLIRSLNLAID